MISRFVLSRRSKTFCLFGPIPPQSSKAVFAILFLSNMCEKRSSSKKSSAVEKKLPNGDKNIKKILVKTTMGKAVEEPTQVKKKNA